MSDLGHYRNQVAELGKRAVSCEGTKDWQGAYENYIAALKIFQHLIKYEKNANLKEIYIEKMKQYLDRAEYIKKTALGAPDHQIAPKDEPDEGSGSGGAATAPKKKQKGGDDDDENSKL